MQRRPVEAEIDGVVQDADEDQRHEVAPAQGGRPVDDPGEAQHDAAGEEQPEAEQQQRRAIEQSASFAPANAEDHSTQNSATSKGSGRKVREALDVAAGIGSLPGYSAALL